MATFNYSIEYVLSLPYPIFLFISNMISDLRKDSAVDNFYLPYTAGKYGGESHNMLFKKNCFIIEEKQPPLKDYTPQELEEARKRLNKHQSKRNSQ